MKIFKLTTSTYQTVEFVQGIDMETVFKTIKKQHADYNKNIVKLTRNKGFLKSIVSIEEVKEK